jgi:cell shape-determining protein MreC
VKEVRSDRIGFALRQLAEDVVHERRRAMTLERENRELKAQLEALQRSVEAHRSLEPDSRRNAAGAA